MKKTSIQMVATAALAAGLLAACGGGDDDLAGGQTGFTIVPEEEAVKAGAPNTCPGGGNFVDVQVIGGSPPYRIFNTHPQFLLVSTDVLDTQAGSFRVTWLGGCFENLAITVRDSQNRLATFSATAEEGD